MVTHSPVDPVALLDEEVRRNRVGAEALEKMMKARTSIVLHGGGTNRANTVFFGSLTLRLDLAPEWGLETMATDGKAVYYDPDFVAATPPDQLIGVYIHELLHNIFAHGARMGGRDPKLWNIAADLAINPEVVGMGFRLPDCALMPGSGEFRALPAGLTAEEYYSRLSEGGQGGGRPGDEDGDGDEQGDEQGEGEGKGKGGQDPGKCGGVRQPGSGDPAEARKAEEDWRVNTLAAAAAVKAACRGDLPAGIDRIVGAVAAPKVDWKAALRDFISRAAKNDVSWRRLNRRMLGQGMTLPGMYSEELGDVVLAVDTSGSIDDAMIRTFGAEVQGILDAYECSMTVLYCDAKIHRIQTWKSSDGPLVMEPAGGGGTSHRPVFDWLDQQDQLPACVVCLTDLETVFPDRGPECPVLWAVVNDRPTRQPPFGAVVPVK